MVKREFNTDPHLRLSIQNLEPIFNKCGWNIERCDNTDYPYNTFYFKFVPRETHSLNSNDIKTMLYGFGYWDIEIDYKGKYIILYV